MKINQSFSNGSGFYEYDDDFDYDEDFEDSKTQSYQKKIRKSILRAEKEKKYGARRKEY